MGSKGIRIEDLEQGVVAVELLDILEETESGEIFHWAILYLQATGNLGEGQSIPEFEKEINESERGWFITWDKLYALSKKFYQIIDILLLGCKNKDSLHRYKNDQEMYETCDIVIEMIDSSFWEVFSKDKKLIERLAKKFKKIKFLEADFKSK